MTKNSKIIYFFVSVIFFIFFDIIISNFLISKESFLPPNKFLDLIYVQNTGAAFSILQGSKIFLILFSTLACALILYYIFRTIVKTSMCSLFWISMLFAGIFCNLYERVELGFVRDFFKLNFVNFPVFNVSDIFINISVFAIVIIIIKHNFSKNNENSNR